MDIDFSKDSISLIGANILNAITRTIIAAIPVTSTVNSIFAGKYLEITGPEYEKILVNIDVEARA